MPAGYSISGVFDLAPLTKVSQNADLRLTEKSAHDVSPLYWQVPPGRILDAVVGGIESSEFLRQSKTIAQAWRQGMAQTRYEEIAGANHFTVVDPLSDPDSAMTKRVVELAQAGPSQRAVIRTNSGARIRRSAQRRPRRSRRARHCAG